MKNNPWKAVLFYLFIKVSLMMLIRMWIKWNVKNMVERGEAPDYVVQ